MLDATYAEAAPKPDVARLDFSDLRAALAAGWRDFTRAPQFGLFFALVYALGGFAMVKLSLGHVASVLTLSLGFPLIAPFAAVGLYVVSRRLARGERLAFLGRNGVLIRVWRERARQIPWIGAIIVIYFLFYTFFAHMLFAVFLGPRALINISEGLTALMTPAGYRMIAAQLLFGAAVALLLYALTVVSIPFALDREVDFITAMLTSLAVVRQNPVVMLAWAALLAGLLLAAMLPWFLGLLIALPVLGHATWHLYERALIHPPESRPSPAGQEGP
ncbi:DUF2189 domain-containing protein [Vannielia litorea]|uniref:DUF2189 domain-containing protein n=1 Tax=Vannielia litorea TaxID=1217970 RepID=UPI001C964771|nr:DUF2189 domain-containing protein [Vannielia litorea]MBY6046787.1 DUF2189 domain-containing protein [Vannielia litorea]MBY6074201.1 DUF2189 domain-containing protein [Vannielia litorea]